MKIHKAVPALLAAAALATTAATAASADSGPAPQPPAAATTTTTSQQQHQGRLNRQRLEQRRRRLEQRRDALQQRRQNLQQRRQELRQTMQQRQQQLRDALQQTRQIRSRRQLSLGSQEQVLVQRLLRKVRGGGIRFRFAGEVTAVSSDAISLNVEGGNHAALVRLAGKSASQSFAVGEQTEYLSWTNGVPTVVDASALKTGDWVAVNVRAPRRTGLDAIEHKPAAIVSDFGTKPNPPDEPLYLFRGKLSATGSSSVTVDVNHGNDRALRLLVGADDTQTFSVGPETIFLLWQGKVPTVVTLGDLKPGDSVTMRVRAKAGSDLATVTSTPAVHVGEHEPANAQSGV